MEQGAHGEASAPPVFGKLLMKLLKIVTFGINQMKNTITVWTTEFVLVETPGGFPPFIRIFKADSRGFPPF